MSIWLLFFFFCKQNTAYEMRISDWSSDVCSSDLVDTQRPNVGVAVPELHDAATALVGICVGAASTLFGIGGPMLSVPLLVAAGVPMLPALAVAQEIGRASCRERVCQYV